MSGKETAATKIVLAAASVFLLAAGIVSARYSGGDGSPENPYRIATPNDLNDIGNHVEDFNKYFVLTNGINMAGYGYSTAVIAPDTNSSSGGFQGTAFTGVFDGSGLVIRNLKIDTTGTDNYYLGLFGQVGETGEVKHLGIEDVDIDGGDGSYRFGGLCASNGGTLRNCYATGTINGGDSSGDIGGLCGSNGDQGTITNCYSNISLRGWYYCQCLGGLCGKNQGTISNCYSSGSVIASSYSLSLGGLCGENYGGPGGTISNCYSSVSVTGVNDSYSLGGLCGLNHHFASIRNSYSNGSVSARDYCECLGGLCGENSATISSCYSSASVSARYDPWWMGGLLGLNSYGVISNCYFLDTCGPDNGHGTALTDAQMKQQNRFVGWDFVGETANGPNDIWTIHETVDYPKHVWKLVNFVGWDGVDFADYSYLADHWSENDCGSSNDCNGTDLDFSDDVDWADVKIFCRHWLEAK